jgi:glycosyltransferase involved in cell wall biosynthesis
MKLAFVVPWFGTDIPGGAETACRLTATKLREAGAPVEVLTTCIREFRSDWSENYHRAGTEVTHGVPVRRFPVGKRDVEAFMGVNQRLMAGQAISADEETVFFREMIRCEELTQFIRHNQGEYGYLFLPYLFSTTYWGALACPQRSILVPCLHDEGYAYLAGFQRVFGQARGVIFHSRAEMELARRLYQMKEDAPALVGGGIATGLPADPSRFQQKYVIDRYLLYAGRKDEGKNVPLLVEYFCRYKDLFPGDLRLVLIGDGLISIPPGHSEEVIDLGFLSEQEKHDAYAGAIALCQPSVNESFSIVLLEAWALGTPALVHEKCGPTRDHCQASNGGLYFSSFQDFVGCLDYFVEGAESARRMGRNGREYVSRNYSWDRVVTKYLQALQTWGFKF